MTDPTAVGRDEVARVVALVAAVPDPELPFVTISDLGILRSVEVESGRVRVCVTPTYSGCPATDAIVADVRAVLHGQGYDDVSVETVLSPAWTTDWLSDRGRQALRSHGIAPPGRGPVLLPTPSLARRELPGEDATTAAASSPDRAAPPSPDALPDQATGYPIRQPVLRDTGLPSPFAPASTTHATRAARHRVDCPWCGSADTEELSRFGATACKALWRCRSCREPFELFKQH